MLKKGLLLLFRQAIESEFFQEIVIELEHTNLILLLVYPVYRYFTDSAAFAITLSADRLIEPSAEIP